MRKKNNRRALLTRYQKRAIRKYQHFLEAAALNPECVLKFAEEAPGAFFHPVNDLK